MKKNLILVLVMLLSIGLITGCGCKKKNNQVSKKDNDKKSKQTTKTVTEKEVIKDREVDGIKITDTSLTVTDGVSYLKASVTNNTGSDYKLEEYKIIVKDEKGDVIITLPGYVGEVIKAGATKTIRSSVSMDLSKAKSIEYEVVK